MEAIDKQGGLDTHKMQKVEATLMLLKPVVVRQWISLTVVLGKGLVK